MVDWPGTNAPCRAIYTTDVTSKAQLTGRQVASRREALYIFLTLTQSRNNPQAKVSSNLSAYSRHRSRCRISEDSEDIEVGTSRRFPYSTTLRCVQKFCEWWHFVYSVLTYPHHCIQVLTLWHRTLFIEWIDLLGWYLDVWIHIERPFRLFPSRLSIQSHLSDKKCRIYLSYNGCLMISDLYGKMIDGRLISSIHGTRA